VRRFTFATVAVAAFVLASAPPASAQAVQDANCPGPGDNLDGTVVGGRVAQTFNILNTGSLTRAEIDIFNSVGDSDWVFQINTVDGSGVPTNTALASQTVSNATVDAAVPQGTEGRIGANFATPAAVTAGQTYALVLSRPTGSFSVDTVGDGSACPGSFYKATSQTDPFVLDSTDDTVFAVFVTPPAPLATGATCKGRSATIVGTAGDNLLVGTPGRDVIAALGGKDKVSGLAGKDLICGGKGKDTLKGGKGKDKLLGQGGRDSLRGGGGKDVCTGGKKDDSAKGCEVEKSI